MPELFIDVKDANNVTKNIATNDSVIDSIETLAGGATLAQIKTGTDKIPTLGQATMANSSPVVIASNQTAVPVSGTVTSNPGNSSPTTVSQYASTTGGGSSIRTLDVQPTATTIKASAGQLYGGTVTNAHATDLRYLKVYNLAAPTQADTPVMVIGVGPKATVPIVLGVPVAFSTAIGIRGTTGIGDADTGAPTANDLSCTIVYA